MESKSLPRTVVVKPCCIGDCVMALPALDALAIQSGNQRVRVLAGPHSSAVFSNRDTVADIIHCPEQTSANSMLRWVRCFRRERSYDRLVILDRSRLLWKASAISHNRSRFHLESVAEETRHESEVYKDLVRSIGIDVGETSPRMSPTEDSMRLAARLIPGDGPYAMLHPGGGQNPGTTMLEKRWPVERFAQLARWLELRSVRVVLTGSNADIPTCEAIAMHLGSANVSIVAGQADLMTTAALAKRASVFIGSDTGVSHVAAAVGAPSIVIFGPTNPGRYRPIGERVTVLCPPESWKIADTDLRNRTHRLTNVSVASVTTAEVVEAVERVLEETSIASH